MWKISGANTIHGPERLREALADIREWAKHDDFIRFDDGDMPLSDFCTRALHGGK